MSDIVSGAITVTLGGYPHSSQGTGHGHPPARLGDAAEDSDGDSIRRLASAPVELVVGEVGDGFGAGPGVDPEGAQVPVAALGLENHRRRPALGQMRKRRVAQLVEGPAARVSTERCCGGAVAEPGLAGRAVSFRAVWRCFVWGG